MGRVPPAGGRSRMCAVEFERATAVLCSMPVEGVETRHSATAFSQCVPLMTTTVPRISVGHRLCCSALGPATTPPGPRSSHARHSGVTAVLEAQRRCDLFCRRSRPWRQSSDCPTQTHPVDVASSSAAAAASFDGRSGICKETVATTVWARPRVGRHRPRSTGGGCAPRGCARRLQPVRLARRGDFCPNPYSLPSPGLPEYCSGGLWDGGGEGGRRRWCRP